MKRTKKLRVVLTLQLVLLAWKKVEQSNFSDLDLIVQQLYDNATDIVVNNCRSRVPVRAFADRRTECNISFPPDDNLLFV